MKCITKMNSQPDNIIFVKVGTLYNDKHVNSLYSRLIEFFPNSTFWCYTDNPTDINPKIKIVSPIKTLKKWWAKLALFSDKMPFEGTCLFFDLDLKIKQSIDSYLTDFSGLTVLNAYWKSDTVMYPHGYDVTINSSIIQWTAKQQNHIWAKFMSNKDYFMRKYKGIDRFLHHENIDYNTFKDGIVNTMFLNDREAPVDIYNGLKYEL